MKHQVIALKKHSGRVKINAIGETVEVDMGLPDGCSGILFVFDSKRAAREYWGNDVSLVRFEYEKTETNK